MVLLHGLVGKADDWTPVLERLGRHYRMMALHIPIFGSRAVKPSIAALADYVANFLRVTDLPPVILGGNSLGGHTSLAVALRDRQRVRGLVLTGSSGLSGTSVVRKVPRTISREFLHGQIREVFHDTSLASPHLVDSVRAMVGPIDSLLQALRMIRAARRTILDDQLHELRLPVLLIWGNQDRITPPDTATRFQALLPDAEVALIDACGHAPMLERPGVFATVLDAWLVRMRRALGPLRPDLAPS